MEEARILLYLLTDFFMAISMLKQPVKFGTDYLGHLGNSHDPALEHSKFRYSERLRSLQRIPNRRKHSDTGEKPAKSGFTKVKRRVS